MVREGTQFLSLMSSAELFIFQFGTIYFEVTGNVSCDSKLFVKTDSLFLVFFPKLTEKTSLSVKQINHTCQLDCGVDNNIFRVRILIEEQHIIARPFLFKDPPLSYNNRCIEPRLLKNEQAWMCTPHKQGYLECYCGKFSIGKLESSRKSLSYV